jgi:protoporphyrin/coproporphyrin ferrochelatase
MGRGIRAVCSFASVSHQFPMTPRDFLRRYQYDQRLVTGEYYPMEPLKLVKGDKVGVVLMNLGGPYASEDVAPFLYNLFMDPAIIDIPVRGIARHWLCKLISSTRARSVGKDYEVIGGGSPINRLTREQAEALEKRLNEVHGKAADVEFRTYIAMRYWNPSSEEAAENMARDGITKVVLLPLYPQYSKTTTGSSLIYWWTLEKAGEIEKWPTTLVYEYAANPKYVQAISERIDEALQRFPKEVRGEVHLLFSAHGTPVREMKERRDPYCCLVHSTVERVMRQRGNDRPFHVAFQSKVGPAEWLTPSTPDKIKELSEQGHKALLVIPVAFVTDHVETAFELDVEVREEAEEFGIEHYEVTSGLNCHPLFIDSLTEAVLAQVGVREAVGIGAEGGGSDAQRRLACAPYPLRPQTELQQFSPQQRSCRCHQCEYVTEALAWSEEQRAEEQQASTT